MLLHFNIYFIVNTVINSSLFPYQWGRGSIIGPDDVIVTGVLSAKWSPDLKDVRCDLDPMLIANHVR